MSRDILNAVKEIVINWANSEGIELVDHFEDRDAFAQWIISFTLKQLVDVLGMDVRKAYEIVFGEGSYKNLADSVWDQLQTS